MAWGSVTTSDELTLSGTFADVQKDAADMVISLNPGESAHVQIEFDPEATPTEFLEWHILSSPDGGTTWDTAPYDAGTLGYSVDPARISTVVRDIHTFKIEAAVIDTDGTAGGDDVASTCTVLVRKNGISL